MLRIRFAAKHTFNFTSRVLLQIVSVNSNSEMIVQNVPDELAAEIPRALLLAFSNIDSLAGTINKKKWKRQQVGSNADTHTHTHAEHTCQTACHFSLFVLFFKVELFFNAVAVESATAALGGVNK